jgi:uncharacterized membrane protein
MVRAPCGRGGTRDFILPGNRADIDQLLEGSMELITHPKHAVNVGKNERIASMIGGGMLAFMGLKRGSWSGWALTALGGEMLYRGATGYCPMYGALGIRTADKGQGAATTSVPYELGIRVEHSVTVNKPRAEVYSFWRNLENLPQFMKHLHSVRVTGDKRSHWVACGPAGRSVEWDAEIINEIPDELIGWRSLEGSQVDNAGSVHFKDTPNGRGTEVRVLLQYNPPAGVIGATLAKIWGEEPSQQIQEDLRRFKAIMEAGEVPTTEGQPHGTQADREDRHSRREWRRSDEVTHASEQSFPASDSPAWTPTASLPGRP